MLFFSRKTKGISTEFQADPLCSHLLSTRDKTGNCRAGFVADEGICHPVTLDFYLQSHTAVKGSGYLAILSAVFSNRFMIFTPL